MMVEQRVKRLVLVEDEGRLIGLVDRPDPVASVVGSVSSALLTIQAILRIIPVSFLSTMSEKLTVDSSLPSSTWGHSRAPKSQMRLEWAVRGRHQAVTIGARVEGRLPSLPDPP